jgi:hypothetical protein
MTRFKIFSANLNVRRKYYFCYNAKIFILYSCQLTIELFCVLFSKWLKIVVTTVSGSLNILWPLVWYFSTFFTLLYPLLLTYIFGDFHDIAQYTV